MFLKEQNDIYTQLNKLRSDLLLDNIFNREAISKKLKTILKSDIIQKIISNFSRVESEYYYEQAYRRIMLVHYDRWSASLRVSSSCPMVHYCLEMAESTCSEDESLDPLFWKRGALIVATRFYLREKQSFPKLMLLLDEPLDFLAKKLLDNPVNIWDLLNTKNDIKRDVFLDSILKVQNFNSFENNVLWNSFRGHAIIACTTIIDELSSIKRLTFVTANSISYKFVTVKSKKPEIILSIDDKQIIFHGDTASMLNLSLKRSLKKNELGRSVEFEEFLSKIKKGDELADKRNYNIARSHIERVNTRILSNFSAYGISDFLIQEKYCVKINPIYAHLITIDKN